MKEEIYTNALDIKNKRFYLLFKLKNADGDYIGDYTLRKVKDNLVLVENYSFVSGRRYNQGTDFKEKSGDKFSAEFLDALTSELNSPEELIAIYDMLETNPKLKKYAGTDVSADTYLVHKRKFENKKTGFSDVFVHTRDTIYNDEKWNNIATKQCVRNIKLGDKQNSKLYIGDITTAATKKAVHDRIIRDLGYNNLLTSIAKCKDRDIDGREIDGNPLINTRISPYLLKCFTSGEYYNPQLSYKLDKEMENYLGFRDAYVTTKKTAERARDIHKLIKEKEEPKLSKEKPKVKQLTFFDKFKK